MRKSIKTAAEAVDEVLNKAEDAVEDIVEETKKVASKAKRQVKAVAEKAEPAAEEVKKAVRATRKKMTPEVYVQWAGIEVSLDELVEQAKAAYKSENKGAITSCKVYVKPEENMAYYVVNDVEGKIEL